MPCNGGILIWQNLSCKVQSNQVKKLFLTSLLLSWECSLAQKWNHLEEIGGSTPDLSRPMPLNYKCIGKFGSQNIASIDAGSNPTTSGERNAYVHTVEEIICTCRKSNNKPSKQGESEASKLLNYPYIIQQKSCNKKLNLYQKPIINLGTHLNFLNCYPGMDVGSSIELQGLFGYSSPFFQEQGFEKACP